MRLVGFTRLDTYGAVPLDSGPLFVNPEHVVAVYSDRSRTNKCSIYVSGDLVYQVHGEIEEVIAKLKNETN